jgi:hypothetical protein
MRNATLMLGSWKMTRRTWGCLIAAIAIPFAFGTLLFGAVVYQLILHTCVRERALFVIPGTQIELEHSRIGTHLMMAEYERDISFYRNGKRVAMLPLEPDTCGGYPINCYLIKTADSTLLRLDDAVSEHVIDLSGHSVYVITRAMGKTY